MHYKHVVFDFDGVICDSLGAAIMAYNDLRDRYFPALPSVADKNEMSLVYQGSLRTCLHRWLSPEDARRFFDLHSAAMESEAPSLRMFPGIATLLRDLGQGTASIVTSAYSEAVQSVLRSDPKFDSDCIYAVCGREQQQSKTAKIHALLRRLSLDCSQAVYVGDLESDILYCRDVPIDIIAVGYGYQMGDYLSERGATYFVKSVEELKTLLSSMCLRSICAER